MNYSIETENLLKDSKNFLTKNIEVDDYEALINTLLAHNRLYYWEQQPIISDFEYDQLFQKLVDFETKNPEKILEFSPTQKVISMVQSDFQQASHKYPLLSLQNTYSADDILAWHKSLNNILSKKNIDIKVDFSIEPKYDGLTIELIYKNWLFFQAITRWDWNTGEDVTANIKTIRSIPWKIDMKNDIHIRWEVMLPKAELEKINIDRKNSWLPEFSNTRNAASGSLRQLDTSITAWRKLDFFAYDILNFFDFDLQSQEDTINFLKNLGFKNFWLPFNQFGVDIEKVVEICSDKNLSENLQNQVIEFDGLVIKLMNLNAQNLIGSTNHHPRWAFAFKFPATQYSTKLIGVDWQVWRTWNLTPVAKLEPVLINNVKVTNCSLHNIDFIKSKDIQIWDQVFIQRSWEVIPYISGVALAARNETHPVILPTHCPVCWHEVFFDEPFLTCPNISCPAQLKEKIAYFCSRDCFDIEGLWEKYISLLVDQNILKNLSDIFSIKNFRNTLLSLPGFAQKRVDELLLQIEKSKSISLDRLLASLWIQHIWKVTSRTIVSQIQKETENKQQANIDAKKFLEFLWNEEFIKSIHWIWPQMVKSLKAFVEDKNSYSQVLNLESQGVIFQFAKKNIWELENLNFAITWDTGFKRSELVSALQKKWATFSENINSKTNLLIVGSEPSSKLQKAKEMGIEILEAKEIQNRFWINISPQKPQEEENLFGF